MLNKTREPLYVQMLSRTSDSVFVVINNMKYLVYAGDVIISVFERLLRKGAKHAAKTYLFKYASSYEEVGK